MWFHWRYYCKRGWSIFYAKCCFQANNRIWKFFYEIYTSMSRICVLFFYFFRFKFLSQFTQKSIENPLDSSNQRFLNRVLFVTMPFQNTAMYFLDMPGRISFVTKFLGHFKHAKTLLEHVLSSGFFIIHFLSKLYLHSSRFELSAESTWLSRICGFNFFYKQKIFHKTCNIPKNPISILILKWLHSSPHSVYSHPWSIN